MLRKLIQSLFILLLIVGCEENLIEEVKERYDSGEPNLVEYYKNSVDPKNLVRKRKYFPDGEIFTEENYKNGIKHGKHTLFYGNVNRQIHIEFNYKDGKTDGLGNSYYLNGILESKVNYKDGEKDGNSTYYNKDGSISKVEEWKEGKLVE